MTGAIGVRRDDGVLSVAVTVLVVLMLAGAGLIVDGGGAMAERRHAAAVAEGAARAAFAAQSPSDPFDVTLAVQSAVDHARRRGVDPSDAEVAVIVGTDGEPEVVVTVTRRRVAVVLALAGVEQLTVRARGSATHQWSADGR